MYCIVTSLGIETISVVVLMLHKTTRLGSFEPLRCVVTKRERFLDTLLKPHKSILTSEMQNATPAVFGL